MNPMMVATLVILVVVVAGDYLLRRHVSDKILRMYAKGHFRELASYTNGGVARYLYPAFNRLMMQLNAYAALGENVQAEEVLDRLLGESRLRAEQRAAVVARGFEFYVEQGNRDKAKSLLGEIEQTVKPDDALQSRQLFDIALDGSAAYLDTMLKELEAAEGVRRIQLLYLVSCQYENKGDMPSAEKYRRLSMDELGKM